MKKKMFFLLLTLLLQVTIHGQENTTSFLDNYKRWSVFWQYTINKEGSVNKQNKAVQFSVPTYVNNRFGVLYNIYQTNQLNFKIGILYEIKGEENNIIFTKEQTGWLNDIPVSIILFEQTKNMWSIPFIIEYIKPLSKTIKWVLGSGFTISHYKGFSGVMEVPFRYDSTKSIIINYNDLSDKPIHTSTEISTGFYFLLKSSLLLQIQLRYSKSFTTLKSGSYLTRNFIDTSNNTTGTYKQSGDYLGFSLTINFKKKNKKE